MEEDAVESIISFVVLNMIGLKITPIIIDIINCRRIMLLLLVMLTPNWLIIDL